MNTIETIFLVMTILIFHTIFSAVVIGVNRRTISEHEKTIDNVIGDINIALKNFLKNCSDRCNHGWGEVDTAIQKLQPQKGTKIDYIMAIEVLEEAVQFLPDKTAILSQIGYLKETILPQLIKERKLQQCLKWIAFSQTINDRWINRQHK